MKELELIQQYTERISNSLKVINEEIGELRDEQKHLNNEIGEIRIDIAKLKTNMGFLLKFFWIIATASIGALVVGLIQLLIK